MSTKSDDAVEAIVNEIHPMPSVPGTMLSYHQSCRDALRRAIQAGRELGQKDSSDGPCTRAEAFSRGLVEGARRMQKKCAELVNTTFDRADEWPSYLDNPVGALADAERAIRELNPEDV